ncbi:unannotated protein [freshwater metagenome]|uniref:Unannotated protein n=1 Tax=freshwater metagenome TaxID=449393 RepID=A0A6J5ZHN8_9ZZZZ
MSRPTLGNWMQQPHLRWSFTHVREIIPTAQVDPPLAMRALHTRTKPEIANVVFESSTGKQKIADFLANSESDALVVVKGDELLFEWHTSGMKDMHPHLIFSVTKSVTALIAGALISAGKLKADAPITDYVPEVAGSGFGNATVRNLLDMTISIEFVEDYTPGQDVIDYRTSTGWFPAESDSKMLHAFLASRKPEGEHGKKFRYLSPATDMLGWVIENASGLSYAEALSQFIWQPMGAEFPAHMTVNREGSPRAAGGLSVTTRDMARIGMLVRDGGMGSVSKDFIEDIFHGGSHELWAVGDFKDVFVDGVYRSCFYRPGVDPDVVMGIGIHGQMLYIDRPRGVVVAKQSSWSNPDEEVDHNDAYLACQAIARSLG